MAYQFKVTLQDIEPTIWRRFLVPKDYTVAEFTYAIEDSMQWHGVRLHRFIIEKSIPLPDYEEDEHYRMLEDIPLDSILKYDIQYEYNIGDNLGEGWMHTVEFEGEVDRDILYPVCLDGARACPPEQPKGYPQGYYKFLEIVNDLDYPERDRIMWLNDAENGFDPEKFDISTVRYRKYFTPTCLKEYW